MRSGSECGANPARPDGKFAQLQGARRVWAIPALNGEARRLAQLHDAISGRFQEGDRIVYLGNYLGYGEAVLATIDELLNFRRRVLGRPLGGACDVVYLRGTQEEMWQKLLQLQFAPNPREVLQWMLKAGMEATVRAYGGDPLQGLAASRDGARAIARWTAGLRSAVNAAPGHTPFFSALRHAAFTGHAGVLFVHAAIDSSRPLAAQRDAFWWGREDILDLAASFEGFTRVVRGIDSEWRGVVEREFAASVDAGAGRGGRLIAACFGIDGAVIDTLHA
jgi:serine/threonine protein phosphatase 1